ncbi:endonuclease NucS [Halorussus lipolyticus]|uniref:endonuclease NucS n=1 Tax=Halorussus lipolyticus TaxID=3034024 RepID=UPI0023E8A57E|nr:endonuclease NucS [Halorussus sp. DT80]
MTFADGDPASGDSADSDPADGDSTSDGSGEHPAESDTLHRPDAEEARARVATAIDRAEMITVFGRCTVEYEGRAVSTLGPGDRLVVLKPDGTALVHTDEGQKPVNWQPPGCAHEAGVEDGQFRIRSVRSSPDEELLVAFEQVQQVATFDVTDQRDLALRGTEEDLRQRILDDPDLVEPGFRPLATERETPAGAVDIYGEDRDGKTIVVELKRKRVGPDAVGQLARYVEALDRDLHADAEIRGILVSPSVTERARKLLGKRGLEFVSLGPPE